MGIVTLIPEAVPEVLAMIMVDTTRSAHGDWQQYHGVSPMRISDDNAVSLFWLPYSRHRQAEEHLWRTLCV
jgi:hypothetical protein